MKAFKIYLLISCMIVSFGYAKAQYTTRLVMRVATVWCDNTTEAGEDEIVLSYAAQAFDGRNTSGAWPSNPGGASINDGNPPRQYNDIYFDLPYLTPGQQCNVKLVLSEIDGGNSDIYVKASQAILAKACPNNPYCLIATGFLELCNQIGIRIVDTDDFIGAINLTVSSDASANGLLRVNYSNTERCIGVYSWNNIPNSMIVNLNGDGSNYKLYLQFYYL